MNLNLQQTRLLEFLIFLSIFYFIKKELDVLIDVRFPTYESLQQANSFWKHLIILRRIFTFILFLAVLFLLSFFKLNFDLIVICLIMLVYVGMYMLINERFIYYFIDKNKENDKIVGSLYSYGSITIDILLLTYSSYALFRIFNPFK